MTPGPAFAILHNGCDRLANGLTNIATRCFPENYLTANPQLNAATYIGNLARSNYHALQVSYTLRPTKGFIGQVTYSFAKSMQLGGGGGPGLADAGTAGANFGTNGYTDPLNRNLDRIRGLESLHNMRMNGTIDLPVGPGRLLFASAHGPLARIIEHWQTSFILNMGTGTPASITGAGPMRYGNPRYKVTNDVETAPRKGCLERTQRKYRNIFRKQLCSGKRPSVPGRQCSRRFIDQFLYAERTGQHSVRIACQCTGESETWRDRNPREPYAGRPRYLLSRWEPGEIVPSYRDQATFDSTGRHEHPESSATHGSHFRSRRRDGLRRNPRQRHYNFRSGHSGPAELPGTDPPLVLGFSQTALPKRSLRTEN